MSELVRFAFVALIVATLSALYFMPTADVDHPSSVANPTLDGAPTEKIKPQKVVVYSPDAKKKLPVPDKVKGDKDAHVLAATTCQADDRAHTVTTVISETSGESVTFDHRESLPWLTRKTRHRARIDYGYKPTGAVTRISYAADLLQVKALHFGVNSAIDSDGIYFIGVGVEWRF